MRFIQRVFLVALLIVSSLAISTSAQKAVTPASDVLLAVGGEVATPLKPTRADLDNYPRQALRAKDHDGKDYKYEGVAIVDILQKAGLKFGDAR